MTAPLSALSLARDGWQRGLAAAVPNLAWLGLLALAGGAYSASLHMEGSLAAPLVFAFFVFGAGLRFSCGLYGQLLGPRTGGLLALGHANSAVYLAFVFIGFFVGFFLLILPGILIEAQGKYELGSDAAPELLRQAFLDMLPTAYGAVYLMIAAVGAWILSFFALRLTLFGAATFDQGKALVFQTFPWTRNHLRTLGLAALATHVAPFALGLAANAALRGVMPETMAGHFIEGAAGILLFTPFLMAGHGMAAAAHGALKPVGDTPA